MSWQEYIDDHLMAVLPCGKTLESAAIVGQQGGVWAKSKSFPDITDDQIILLAGALESKEPVGQNPSKNPKLEQLQKDSFHIGEKKFLTLRCEEGAVVRGRETTGSHGVVIKRSETALVLGIYEFMEGMGGGPIAGDANVVIERMGDYLANQGF